MTIPSHPDLTAALHHLADILVQIECAMTPTVEPIDPGAVVLVVWSSWPDGKAEREHASALLPDGHHAESPGADERSRHDYGSVMLERSRGAVRARGTVYALEHDGVPCAPQKMVPGTPIAPGVLYQWGDHQFTLSVEA